MMFATNSPILFLLTFTILARADHDLLARQAVTSYSPAQTASCLNVAQSCWPTVSSCAQTFCSSCASVAGPDFVSCCTASNAAACFATLLSSTTTTDQNFVACQIAVDLVASCASATTGFSHLNAGHQASCLCYTASGSSTIYAPKIYDNAWDGCIAYAKTSDVSDYAAFQSLKGLCTAVGNVRASATVSTSVNATTTSSSSGSGSATMTSSSDLGVAVSTRTASLTSGSGSVSASRTQSIVPTSSSAAAKATRGSKFHVIWQTGFPLGLLRLFL